MKGIYSRIPKAVAAELQWGQGLKFVSKTGSENELILDAAVEHGGTNEGVRPMEALLSALAGCMGMDLVTILTKKKRNLSNLKIIIHGKRSGEHPHVLESIHILFDVWGADIQDEDIQWAINLSLSKYCSISATLTKSCKIDYKWNIHK